MNKMPGVVCAICSVVCLSPGLLGIGQWVALGGGVLACTVWLFAHKLSSIWLSTTALVISIAMSAIGLVYGDRPMLMLLGTTLALASWDLAHLEHDLVDCTPLPAVRRLKQRHFEGLGLVLGIGLLAAAAGRILRFQFSFWMIFLLVVGALFSLDRFWRMLEK